MEKQLNSQKCKFNIYLVQIWTQLLLKVVVSNRWAGEKRTMKLSWIKTNEKVPPSSQQEIRLKARHNNPAHFFLLQYGVMSKQKYLSISKIRHNWVFWSAGHQLMSCLLLLSFWQAFSRAFCGTLASLWLRAVRVTVDMPSTNLVLKRTLAFVNMPSFKDTTTNCREET